MTKFEKIAKRAEILAVAYDAIIGADKWNNYEYQGDERRLLIKGKEEIHDLYLKVADEIESLL